MAAIQAPHSTSSQLTMIWAEHLFDYSRTPLAPPRKQFRDSCAAGPTPIMGFSVESKDSLRGDLVPCAKHLFDYFYYRFHRRLDVRVFVIPYLAGGDCTSEKLHGWETQANWRNKPQDYFILMARYQYTLVGQFVSKL